MGPHVRRHSQWQESVSLLSAAGNSAGQTALFFANYASSVTLLVRGEDLKRSMSKYLVDQIALVPGIRVETETQVISADGTDCLKAIETRKAKNSVLLVNLAARTAAPQMSAQIQLLRQTESASLGQCAQLLEPFVIAVAADFDDDGWPDIYVACDSSPSLLLLNTSGCARARSLKGHESRRSLRSGGLQMHCLS